jgi:hypothetical protein
MRQAPVCRNPDCTEHDLPKGSIDLADGETVICGTCGQPCELTPAGETKPATDLDPQS